MKKRFQSPLLLGVLLFMILLAACRNGQTPDETAPVTDGAATEQTSAVTDAGTDAETEPDDKPPVLTGWFDYGSALYLRDKFTPGDKREIAIQMARNETEGFQYLVTADRDVEGLRCDVTPLSDGEGHTLEGTVNVVWYTWVDHTDNIHEFMRFYPVAMLPMDDSYQGGSFRVTADTCRTLYVSFRTDKDTVPGTYQGELTVSKDGQTLLSGGVSVRVRDVYYDEKTECLTMMGLGYDKEDTNQAVPPGPDSAPALGGQQASGTFVNRELLVEYAEYLLDNRFCTTWLPFQSGLFESDFDAVKRFLDSPRCTSVNISPVNLPQAYQIVTENGWMDKIYFALFDEPHEEGHFQYMLGRAREIAALFPTTHFLDAFGVNLSDGSRNIVERMSDYTTSYCANTIAFNGEIRDSMLRLKAERGDTLFWYVCGSQTMETINALPCTPGTDKRVLFWQQYQQNVDGFLYWSVTHWNISTDVWVENYENQKFPFPKPNGPPTDDGILIYWHPVTKKPVPTLGFEAMRDGVEDFQLFRMVEAKLGRDAVIPYIEQITTGPESYIRYEDGSTELLNRIRGELFDLLEAEGR